MKQGKDSIIIDDDDLCNTCRHFLVFTDDDDINDNIDYYCPLFSGLLAKVVEIKEEFPVERCGFYGGVNL